MIHSYKIKELKKILRKDHKSWCELHQMWRQLSIYITWFCTKISISASTISLISLFFFIISIVCFLFNGLIVSLTGVFSLNFYRLLDHVDGELNRYEDRILNKAPTLLRKYLDSMVHKFTPAVFFALGFAVDKQTGGNIFSLLGFLCGLFISGIASEPAKIVLTHAIFNNPQLVKEKKINTIFNLQFKSQHTDHKLRLYLMTIRSILINPGWTTLISIVVVFDAFLSSPVLFGIRIPYRGLFLIFITPVYFIHLLIAISWYSSIMSSIKR